MISGLNHITFAVSDLYRSIEFYRDLLGFTLALKWHDGAYLEAGDLWLCLSSCEPVDRHSDYTHIAFTATQYAFAKLKSRLEANSIKQWQENRSEGNSLYLLDPDDRKLEVHVGSLQSRLQHIRSSKQQTPGCNAGE